MVHEMNVDVEDLFTEVLRTGQGDFVGSLAELLRQFPRCEGLDEFIVGNGLGPSYLALFKRHCRDGDPHAVREFLQAVASRAEFEHIDEYLNSQSAAAPITYKLGLGSESSNPGAGELGNKIRNALRLDRDARSRNPQATAQAGGAAFPMRTFHGTPASTPGRGATTYSNDHHFNPGTPGGASYTFNTPGGRFVPNNFYPSPGTPGGDTPVSTTRVTPIMAFLVDLALLAHMLDRIFILTLKVGSSSSN